MPVIATDVLLCDTIEDSNLHDEASKTLNVIDPWLILPDVIYEYALFLHREGVPSKKIKRGIDEFLEHPKGELVKVDQSLLQEMIQTLLRENCGSPLDKYSDLSVVMLADVLDDEVVSFRGDVRDFADERGVNVIP